MRYVINISRKVGTNLYDNLFVQSYDDENKFNQALIIIEQSLRAINVYKETIIKEDDGFKVAEVNIKSIWDEVPSWVKD